MHSRLARRFLALAVVAALTFAGCDLAGRPVQRADQVGVDPTGETIATESPAPPADPAPAQPDAEQDLVAPERIPQPPEFGQAEPQSPPRSEAGHSHRSHRHRRSSD